VENGLIGKEERQGNQSLTSQGSVIGVRKGLVAGKEEDDERIENSMEEGAL